jgi:RHS repeat-associated protein
MCVLLKFIFLRHGLRYDLLDQLVSAKPPISLQSGPDNPEGLPQEGYDYDSVHNRITSAHQPGAWVYNENNELTQWGLGPKQRTLSYDLNGSAIKEEIGNPAKENMDYVYDAQDRLIEVKKSGNSVVKYAYDPMGRRIWRQAGVEITWFLYSNEGLIEKLKSASSAIRTYGWIPNGMWGTASVWQKDLNGIFIANYDHIYTTDALTLAQNGEVKWSAIRESFGKTSVKNGSTTESLMRFPGQWEDSVSGFSQNYFREFVPETGRYLVRDRLGLGGGVNVFSYAEANPHASFDRFGLISEPSFEDQKNPFGLLDDDKIRDYQDFFNIRFPNTIAEARKVFNERIKTKACGMLPATPSKIPGLTNGLEDFDATIGRQEKLGDTSQSIYERRVQIGEFELKTGPILLNWNNRNICPRVDCFGYSTTMFVWENAGQWGLFLFKERKMVMAQWVLMGGHCCE